MVFNGGDDSRRHVYGNRLLNESVLSMCWGGVAGGTEGKRNAQALFLLYLDAVSVVASRRAELRGAKPEEAAGRSRCAPGDTC